jgi:hypothetical protein
MGAHDLFGPFGLLLPFGHVLAGLSWSWRLVTVAYAIVLVTRTQDGSRPLRRGEVVAAAAVGLAIAVAVLVHVAAPAGS